MRHTVISHFTKFIQCHPHTHWSLPLRVFNQSSTGLSFFPSTHSHSLNVILHVFFLSLLLMCLSRAQGSSGRRKTKRAQRPRVKYVREDRGKRWTGIEMMKKREENKAETDPEREHVGKKKEKWGKGCNPRQDLAGSRLSVGRSAL